jgi:PIN domain nuclease of toxin-antitoxin system
MLPWYERAHQERVNDSKFALLNDDISTFAELTSFTLQKLSAMPEHSKSPTDRVLVEGQSAFF